MIAFLAALLATGQPASSPPLPAIARAAWLFSTIQQSEWCPAGNVRLDLVSGRYALVRRAARRACSDRQLIRPVETGRLGAGALAVARAAFARALADGLERMVCRAGGRPSEIVINNGGPDLLVLATGADQLSAPDDLSCWTPAAVALHDAMDHLFAPARAQ